MKNNTTCTIWLPRRKRAATPTTGHRLMSSGREPWRRLDESYVRLRFEARRRMSQCHLLYFARQVTYFGARIAFIVRNLVSVQISNVTFVSLAFLTMIRSSVLTAI